MSTHSKSELSQRRCKEYSLRFCTSTSPFCGGALTPSCGGAVYFIKWLLFFATLFSQHSSHHWSSLAFRDGKIVNEGNTLFHMQWSQGGDLFKWGAEKATDIPSSSSSSSTPDSDPTPDSSSSTNTEDWIQILSVDDEPYQCSLPKSRGSSRERSQVYSGPTPLSILKELFEKGSCSYRIESYWTYEVCHGKYVRQYHESKDSGKQTNMQEYILGRYDNALQKDIVREPNAELPKIPLKKVDDEILPYFEVFMSEGTPCDLMVGVPRKTSVLYVCHEGGRNEIAHLEETSTCEYAVVIYSPLLCSHPYYQRDEPAIQTIQCFGKNGGKPKRLSQMELAHRQWTAASEVAAAVEEQEGRGSAKTEATAAATPSAEGSSTTSPAASSSSVSPEEDPVSKPAATMPSMMSSQSTIGEITDRQWIDGFLAGENCVQGGTGYWKHELCYRKHARQFHRERDGSQIAISLGLWNEAEHKKWISRNPLKKVKRALSISNLYTGGDYCDANSRPRSVEVKLKCKSDGDPHSVSIYLLEPETCEYIMGVESPLFCNFLDKASTDGILPEKFEP